MEVLLHFCSTPMKRCRVQRASKNTMQAQMEKKNKKTFMNKNGIMPAFAPLLGLHLHRNRTMFVHCNKAIAHLLQS